MPEKLQNSASQQTHNFKDVGRVLQFCRLDLNLTCPFAIRVKLITLEAADSGLNEEILHRGS